MSNDICHCIMLRKAARKVSSYYDEALAPLGINVSQFSLMRNIRRVEPVSLTDLALRVELDRSTVGRNTKLLERMGLIRIGHGSDQREALLTLSDKGRDLLDQGKPLWDAVQDRIRLNLGADGAATLRSLLEAL